MIPVISLKSFNQGVESFGIVFGNIKLNAGSVEGKDVRKRGIDQVADWFGEIDQLVEHLLDIRFKGGPEAGKKRGIGNFGEAAEVPQFPAEAKEKDEQRV